VAFGGLVADGGATKRMVVASASIVAQQLTSTDEEIESCSTQVDQKAAISQFSIVFACVTFGWAGFPFAFCSWCLSFGMHSADDSLDIWRNVASQHIVNSFVMTTRWAKNRVQLLWTRRSAYSNRFKQEDAVSMMSNSGTLSRLSSPIDFNSKRAYGIIHNRHPKELSRTYDWCAPQNRMKEFVGRRGGTGRC
jgi:hypothetical protein